MAIFLSYSRHDEAVVKVLVQGFEAARRQVWFDTHDLGGGDVWWDKILDNIRTSSVFVFGLSDTSLQSKACIAELEYAKALIKPIVPLRVGQLAAMRAHPLAQLHMVDYRPDDASSGFEVLGAVDAAAARAGPLPDPLPPEPPIPYAYLQVLGRQIDTAELDAADQVKLVDQLNKALADETEETVRREIFAMLERMTTRPWVTRRTERHIRAVLIANAAEEAEVAESGPAPERKETEHQRGTAEAPTPRPPPPEPDGRTIFEQRMEALRRREEAREAESRRLADHAAKGAAWQPRSTEAPSWPGVSSTTSGDAGRQATGPSAHPMQHRPGPQPQPAAQPQPAPHSPFPPQGLGGAPLPGHPHSVPPPNYWGLSIVAFLLSFLFGGIAMYFSYQVGQRYKAHDFEGARRASGNAKAWAIVGIVIGSLALLVVIGSGG